MSADYTREVLRDAIPLLEQLTQRLKVLAGMLPPPDLTDEQVMHLLLEDTPSQEC